MVHCYALGFSSEALSTCEKHSASCQTTWGLFYSDMSPHFNSRHCVMLVVSDRLQRSMELAFSLMDGHQTDTATT